MSLTVTSSQRHTKHLPPVLAAHGGRLDRGGGARRAVAPRQRAAVGSRRRCVRVAEAERLRRLGARHRARELGGLERAVAGQLAGRQHVLGQLGRRRSSPRPRRSGCGPRPARAASRPAPQPPDTTSRSQETRALAGPRRPRRRARRRDTPPLPAADHGRARRAPRRRPRASASAAGPADGAQVRHGGELHAGLAQRQRRLEPALADGGHHRPASGAHAVERDQAPRAAARA